MGLVDFPFWEKNITLHPKSRYTTNQPGSRLLSVVVSALDLAKEIIAIVRSQILLSRRARSIVPVTLRRESCLIQKTASHAQLQYYSYIPHINQSVRRKAICGGRGNRHCQGVHNLLSHFTFALAEASVNDQCHGSQVRIASYYLSLWQR